MMDTERTWGNCKKSAGNAGTKGNITAYHGYLHMNAYPVFLTPRLKAGSAEQEVENDKGKNLDKGMRDLFGKGLVPEFCFSTAKLNTGMQYSEGQYVTFHAHNQLAQYSVSYTEDQKAMGFARHIAGIQWKILAIMWCRKDSLRAKAGEPVFVLWSEHITGWDNCEALQETQVHVTYPRWKFVAESRIKAIMTTPVVELSEEQNKIKNMAP